MPPEAHCSRASSAVTRRAWKYSAEPSASPPGRTGRTRAAVWSVMPAELLAAERRAPAKPDAASPGVLAKRWQRQAVGNRESQQHTDCINKSCLCSSNNTQSRSRPTGGCHRSAPQTQGRRQLARRPLPRPAAVGTLLKAHTRVNGILKSILGELGHAQERCGPWLLSSPASVSLPLPHAPTDRTCAQALMCRC